MSKQIEDTEEKKVLPIIRSLYPSLFTAEKKVADLILNSPSDAVTLSVSELAEKSGVSDATVVRFSQKLGFKGFYQMKIILSRDVGMQLSIIDNEKPEDNQSDLKEIFRAIIYNLQETEHFIDYNTIVKCAHKINECETLYFIAAGNTIPTVIDASYRFTRIGIKTNVQMVPEILLATINLVSEKDVVIGISHSGSSKLVADGLTLAKERHAYTVSISNHVKSPVSAVSEENLYISCNEDNFQYFSISKICETAVIDTLLNVVSKLRHQDTYKKVESLESLLSEFKY